MGYTIREGSTRIYVQPGMRTIRATGDGTNSNLTIQGSTIQSEDTTTLAADNQVQLFGIPPNQ
jgi:hypothetical protein